MRKCFRNSRFLFTAVLLFVCSQMTVFSVVNKVDSLKKVLKIAKPKEQSIILIELSRAYLREGKQDLAKQTVQNAIQLSTQHNNKVDQSNAYGYLGTIYLELQDYEKAFESYTKGLNIATQAQLKKEMVYLNNELSVCYYYQQNFDKLNEYSLITLKLAREIKDTVKEAEALNHIGIYYYTKGDLRKTLEYWEQELILKKHIGNKSEIGTALNNVGVIYKNIGDYQKAIGYYQENLEIQKELNDTQKIAWSLSNIGNIYYSFGVDFDKALEYFQKGLTYFEILKDTTYIAQSLLNVGLIYQERVKYPEALKYFEKSMKYAELKDNKLLAALAKNSISIINVKLGNYKMGIKYSTQAMEVFRQEGDNKGLATCYNTLGEAYYKTGYLEKSLEYYFNAVNLNKEIGLKKEIADLYKEISFVYSLKGEYAKAYTYYKKYSEKKDSVLSDTYMKTIEDVNTKYKTAEKEKEITSQKFTISQAVEKDKRKNILIYSIIVVFVVVCGFSVLLFRQFRQIRAQRDQIIHQKQEITDSIHYASRIQRAILPLKETAERLLPEHFILYKPRDIVSGDFYWMSHKGSRVFFTAADCTGHGVPGAFMSMLGTAFLNEIINKVDNPTTDIILGDLRKQVVSSLHQTGKEGESKDGMDMALCMIDRETMMLEYSGANNPLYIVRKCELLEFKADKMPIGFYHEKNDKLFTRHELKLEKGDTIYLTSDGYVDQFGGPDKRKFMKKKFKELILSIENMSMDAQRDFLDKTIEDWRGELDQIDDIMVMGVRVS